MAKALRKFGISFAISTLILGIAALIIMSSIDDVLTGSFHKRDDELSEILNEDTEEAEKNDPASAENALSSLDGDSFTVLAVLTDYRPDVYDDYLPDPEKKDDAKDEKPGMFINGYRKWGAANICLLKCSKETGSYVVVPIPPVTRVQTPAGASRIYDVLPDYGTEYFKTKIEALTGLKIDKYAIMNCTEVTDFITQFGAVWCNVPCEIFTNGVEYLSSTGATAAKVKNPGVSYTRMLEVCEDYIGPSSMGLLLFKDYTNGIDDEMTISASYMRGCAANFKKFVEEGVLSAYWQTLKPYFKETDIDENFLSSHNALIGAYSDEIVKTVNIVGMFKEIGEDGEPVFEIDKPRTVATLKNYR